MNPLHFLLGLLNHNPQQAGQYQQPTGNPQQAGGQGLQGSPVNLQGPGAMQGQIQVPQGRGGGLRVGNANGPVMSGGQLQGSSPQLQGGGDYRFGNGYMQGSPMNPQTTQFGPYLQPGSLPTNQGRFMEDVGLEGDYLQGNNPYRYRGL